MLLIAGPAVGFLVAALAYRWRARRRRVLSNGDLIAKVKRRRHLQRKLARYLGSELDAQAAVRQEARRLGVGVTDIAALESALDRLNSAHRQVAAKTDGKTS